MCDCWDVYFDFFFNKVCEMIKKGIDKFCILVVILKDEEIKFSGVEVFLICLFLVFGGFEMIFGILIFCIGLFFIKEG